MTFPKYEQQFIEEMKRLNYSKETFQEKQARIKRTAEKVNKAIGMEDYQSWTKNENVVELAQIPDTLTWKGHTYKVEKPVTISDGWIYVENKENVSEIPFCETDEYNQIVKIKAR